MRSIDFKQNITITYPENYNFYLTTAFEADPVTAPDVTPTESQALLDSNIDPMWPTFQESDTDEGFTGSQSLENDVLDEYLTSKSNNKDDSFEYWDRNLSFFSYDSLF